MNRLLSDLGITAGPDADPTTIGLPNAMLGFNRGSVAKIILATI